MKGSTSRSSKMIYMAMEKRKLLERKKEPQVATALSSHFVSRTKLDSDLTTAKRKNINFEVN